MSKVNIVCERYNKETDDLIQKDTMEFLQTPISYLKEKKEEYVFLYSESLDEIKVDGIALEYDEVFDVYTAMFGFAVQKKFAATIKAYLDEHFHAENMNYSIMFAGDEGLWEINLPLDYIDQFNTNATLKEVYQILYSYISSLHTTITK